MDEQDNNPTPESGTPSGSTPPPGYTPQGSQGGQIPGAEKKLIAGLLGILLGSLGIHKFYLGYNTAGIIMLVVTVAGGFVTCGIASAVMGVIGLVEGILYLTKTDADFVATYINGKKPWF